MTFHEITELSQIQYIHDRLYEYNLRKTGAEKKEIILTDTPPRYGWYASCGDDGDISGGLVYQLYDNGDMYVDFLWVDDSLRGQGAGTKLLDLAKAKALELNRRAITLYTAAFQAPDFYRNYGFVLTRRENDSFFYRMELDGAGTSGGR